jgi:hypothetical protein
VEHAVQASLDDRAPLRLGYQGQRAVPGDPGAADQRFHRAKFVFGPLEPGRDLGRQSDVGLDGDDPGAELTGGLLDLDRGPLIAAVAEADVPSVRGQAADGGRADTARATADQRYPRMTVAQCRPFFPR